MSFSLSLIYSFHHPLDPFLLSKEEKNVNTKLLRMNCNVRIYVTSWKVFILVKRSWESKKWATFIKVTRDGRFSPQIDKVEEEEERSIQIIAPPCLLFCMRPCATFFRFWNECRGRDLLYLNKILDRKNPCFYDFDSHFFMTECRLLIQKRTRSISYRIIKKESLSIDIQKGATAAKD